ncbi:unnamed protein product [Pylaiella littoralis]
MILRENARLFFISALSSNAKCEDIIRASDFGFRLARKTDIESIRQCNLRTLPENYSSEFYDNHIKDWPELALVAEHADRRNHENQQPQVVGYVLGRMEGSRDDLSTAVPGWSCRDSGTRVPLSPPTGHVTSLAVMPGFRRCGAARHLMDMLHDQMKYHYKATRVSLHVRKSNGGAIRLYEELLGYKVSGIASGYYSDGEDAFIMEARLPAGEVQPVEDASGAPAPPSSAHSHSHSLSSSSRNNAGFVTAAANHNRYIYCRNNVGFVTAAAAAAATVASGTTRQAASAGTAAPPLVMQAVVSTPRLGRGSGGAGGDGGAGGGGGLDRHASKGVPASFRTFSGPGREGMWLPRRPGVGCGGGGGRGGRCGGVS